MRSLRHNEVDISTFYMSLLASTSVFTFVGHVSASSQVNPKFSPTWGCDKQFHVSVWLCVCICVCVCVAFLRERHSVLAVLLFMGVVCLLSLSWYNLSFFHAWIFTRVPLFHRVCVSLCVLAHTHSNTQVFLCVCWLALVQTLVTVAPH